MAGKKKKKKSIFDTGPGRVPRGERLVDDELPKKGRPSLQLLSEDEAERYRQFPGRHKGWEKGSPVFPRRSVGEESEDLTEKRPVEQKVWAPHSMDKPKKEPFPGRREVREPDSDDLDEPGALEEFFDFLTGEPTPRHEREAKELGEEIEAAQKQPETPGEQEGPPADLAGEDKELELPPTPKSGMDTSALTGRISQLERMLKAAQQPTKSKRETSAFLDELRSAKDAYATAKDDLEDRRTADAIIRGLTKAFAGWYGLQKGMQLGDVELEKGVDYKTEMQGLADKLRSDIAAATSGRRLELEEESIDVRREDAAARRAEATRNYDLKLEQLAQSKAAREDLNKYRNTSLAIQYARIGAKNAPKAEKIDSRTTQLMNQLRVEEDPKKLRAQVQGVLSTEGFNPTWLDTALDDADEWFTNDAQDYYNFAVGLLSTSSRAKKLGVKLQQAEDGTIQLRAGKQTAVLSPEQVEAGQLEKTLSNLEAQAIGN